MEAFLSRLRYDILRRFIRSPLLLLESQGIRCIHVYVYIVAVSVQRTWIWARRTTSFFEPGNICSQSITLNFGNEK